MTQVAQTSVNSAGDAARWGTTALAARDLLYEKGRGRIRERSRCHSERRFERDVRRSASAGGTSGPMCGSRRPLVARRGRCAAAGARWWHVGADVRQPAPAGGTSGPMCGSRRPLVARRGRCATQTLRFLSHIGTFLPNSNAHHHFLTSFFSHFGRHMPLPPRKFRTSQLRCQSSQLLRLFCGKIGYRKPQGTWDRKAPGAARHLGSQGAWDRKAPGAAKHQSLRKTVER